jgi:hypothetical protein
LIRHLCELFASSQLEQYSTILQTCVPYITGTSISGVL